MTIRIEKNNAHMKRWMTYLLLFLMALNFNNMFYILYIVFAICFVVFEGRATYSKTVFGRICLLALFSVVYLSVYFWHNEFQISKLVVYTSFPIMFAFGNALCSQNKKWTTPIWVIVMGLAVHGCLNFVTNFSVIFGKTTVRETVDFWTQEEWIATGQISLFILLAGCAYYILFCISFRTTPFLKLALILLLALGMIYNIRLATRTVVYACALSLLIGVVLRWWKSKNSVSKRMRFIFRILCILLVVFIIGYFNIGGIRDWIIDSPLYQRVENIDYGESVTLDSRWGQMVAAFQMLGEKPWGGYTMEFATNLDFIHNTWLNIAYSCGTVAAIIFFIYGLTILTDMWTVVRKSQSGKSAILVVGIYAAVVAYWMLEPVCEAIPSIITLFCFINGLVLRQLQNGDMSDG